MKRFNFKLFVVLSVAILSVMLSCKKEGRYNGDRISTIYREESGRYTTRDTSDASGQTLQTVSYDGYRYTGEKWNWDRDRVSEILYYYSDGTVYRDDVYTYLFGQLLSREDKIGNSRLDYYYSGKRLESVELTVGGNPYATFQYFHRDGKISKIDATYYATSTNKASDADGTGIWSLVLENTMPSLSAAKAGSSTYTQSLRLSWDDENLASAECWEGDWHRWTVKYTYGTELNPMVGFWAKASDYWSELPFLASQNNVLTETYTGASGKVEYYEYNYSYNDGKLSRKECKKINKNGNYTYERRVVDNYNYEN